MAGETSTLKHHQIQGQSDLTELVLPKGGISTVLVFGVARAV